MKLFNLSKEERKIKIDREFFCVVTYDIVSNKRQTKLFKLLSGYGTHMQKSSFEMFLDKSSYHSLIEELSKFYCRTDNDEINIYLSNFDDIIRFSRRSPHR